MIYSALLEEGVYKINVGKPLCFYRIYIYVNSAEYTILTRFNSFSIDRSIRIGLYT